VIDKVKAGKLLDAVELYSYMVKDKNGRYLDDVERLKLIKTQKRRLRENTRD